MIFKKNPTTLWICQIIVDNNLVVKNFNFILHNYTPLTMTNIHENCMKVNV